MGASRFVAAAVWLASISLVAAPASAQNPAGRWSGKWNSFTNQHHGKICAHVSQIDCCTFQVKFCGTFFGVVPFAYSVPLKVTGHTEDGKTLLAGNATLPFFGNFHCNAQASGYDFIAAYWSAEDQGQFVMRRK